MRVRKLAGGIIMVESDDLFSELRRYQTENAGAWIESARGTYHVYYVGAFLLEMDKTYWFPNFIVPVLVVPRLGSGGEVLWIEQSGKGIVWKRKRRTRSEAERRKGAMFEILRILTERGRVMWTVRTVGDEDEVEVFDMKSGYFHTLEIGDIKGLEKIISEEDMEWIEDILKLYAVRVEPKRKSVREESHA